MTSLAVGTVRQIHVDLDAIQENTQRRIATTTYTPVPSIHVYDATTGAFLASGTSLVITGAVGRDVTFAEILGGVRFGQVGHGGQQRDQYKGGSRATFKITTDAALTVT